MVTAGANDAGRRLYVLGADIAMKIATADTRGRLRLWKGRLRHSRGPPLHRHKFQDEWWYIIEGQFKSEVDGQTVFAGPGDTVFAPR